MKKNTFFEKTAAPEPIHLMTEVTSILDSICKYSALAKTALMAVLVSGTFTDNGYRMPSTAAVVSNFKKVSKDMKRHTLSVFVDDPLDARADDNGYFTMPLF